MRIRRMLSSFCSVVIMDPCSLAHCADSRHKMRWSYHHGEGAMQSLLSISEFVIPSNHVANEEQMARSSRQPEEGKSN